jgi:hypothetical protein
MKISEKIANIAYQLQENITLPIHGELRLDLFELAEKISKIENTIQQLRTLSIEIKEDTANSSKAKVKK